MWNLSALLLLAAGLVSFVVFHLVPGFKAKVGWELWVEVGQAFQRLSFLRDPSVFVPLASFLMLTVLIVASPFLTGVLRKSRLCWWMATTMSALAAIAFTVLIVWRHGPSAFGLGGWFLFAAPLFNLLGLLMIRGSRSASSLG